MDAAELRLRVWDKDFVGKEFLGEVRCGEAGERTDARSC